MSDYNNYSKQQLIDELERLQAKQDTATSSRDGPRLRHELEVHQIELEMQNRELHEKQQELELARDKYADLYDFAPVGYLTLDNQGKILEINLTAAHFLEQNRSHMLDKPFTGFLASGYSQDFLNGLHQTLKTDQPRVLELQLRTKSAASLTVKL
ncbi:MAG: PAS domain-containing protein, partial [Candidatus Competibacteraceae bacterium]|nr:PAS domain-containing protein [Candidatus Competibacteraceae bacterium]